MKVLCIGHSTYDITIPVLKYPLENTKNRTHDSVMCGGGPASNAAYLLSKWGVDTTLVSLVGNDLEGKKIKREFENVGTNLEYFIMDDDYHTTKSYIIVSENGSRTSISCQSNTKNLGDLDVNIDADIILIDGHEYELSKKIIEKSTATVVIDAGRCNREVIDLCHMSDYIICSKDFAIEYCHTEDLNDIFNKMINDFSGEVIVTLDKEGCAYYDNGVKVVKTIPVNVADTTGCGDIFHGSFVYGLTKYMNLYDNLTFASTTSGMSATKIGARRSIYPVKDVLKVYDELRRSNFY